MKQCDRVRWSIGRGLTTVLERIYSDSWCIAKFFKTAQHDRYVAITDNQLRRIEYANYLCTWRFQPEVQQS